MQRHSYWEEALTTYLDTVAEEPFKWGSHDCALFAASAVQRMTGVDIAADFRGRYDTAKGAALALREVGEGTLFRTIKGWFGAPVNVHFAKRGDLVMRNATALGVCVGLYSWFVGEEAGHHGLVVLPTAACSYAFHVPFDGPAVEETPLG